MTRYSGITPRIQDTTVVFTWDGVAITSDLDSQWDAIIRDLAEFDYSSIGGSPISQYVPGLSAIHFESFEFSGGYGLNLTNLNGQLGTGFITATGFDHVLGHTSTLPGVDTIYIDTTNFFGRPASPTLVAGVMIHEMLHESRIVDEKAQALIAALPTDSLDNDTLQALRGAAEHVVIGGFMEELAKSNNLEGYLKWASSYGQYVNIMEKILKGAGVPKGAIDESGVFHSAYGYLGSISEANGGFLQIGTNDLGGVASYINEQGETVTTSEGSNYSENMLRTYGVETRDSNGDVHARMTLGGHFRALADWLGFDGEFGVQGTYAHGNEGTAGNAPNDAAEPVILDLDGDGVEVNASAQVSFDWDGDGFLESGNWAAADDGFLVVDLDADGSIGTNGGDGGIDQGREIAVSQWIVGDATDPQALAA